MGYLGENGTWRDTDELTLAASAARTTTANGDWVEIGDRGTARLTLAVTAGNGTLDVDVETSEDKSTDIRTVASFTQKAGAGSQRKCFAGCDRYVRAKWTIGGGGSPTFTFGVSGEAA